MGKKHDEKKVKLKIAEILNQEKINEKENLKEGIIYLTDDYLLWEKKKKVDS